jgi:Common central domain of tyrosinase
MTLGDGIRRNIAHVEPSERIMLRNAILTMHTRYYPGNKDETPPGGVSWWFKQDEIHQATHVHGGPEFLPWHRELTNRFEQLIREINPQLSLHYWDFADDPTNIPDGNLDGGSVGLLNLFDENFLGAGIANQGDHDDPDVEAPNRDAGNPWLAAWFYDPKAGSPGHPPFRGSFDGDPNGTNNPVDLPRHMARTKTPGTASLSTADEQDAIVGDNTTYPTFHVALERLHNRAHGYIARVSAHIAFRDPLVFLLHSNVDRLFAKWQTDPAHPERLDPATVYGAETNLDVTVSSFGETHVQNLTHLVEPWSTGAGEFHPIRPWEPTHENQGFPHTYAHPSVVRPPRYAQPQPLGNG